MLRIVLLLLCLLPVVEAMAARGWTTSAEAVLVVDADTLVLDGERVRLWGVDAPEDGQPCRLQGKDYDCGAAAEAGLFELLDGRDLWCEVKDIDRYNRTVAVCRLDDENGADIADLMVRAGWAVDYRTYSKGAYAAAEREARVAHAGMWAGEFMRPATCRKVKCQVRKR